MKTHTLPKAGSSARVGLLGEADLVDVLTLQEATRAALPEDKKTFMLMQSTSYFQNLLTQQTGLMIGVRAEDGTLIAQMALMGPMELREAIALHVITSNDVPFHHAALTDSVVVCKSMAAHPDWRGNDLANTLVTFALSLPFAQAAAHIFAQISVGNKRSWGVFVKQGFGIVAAAYDPKDGQPRFIIQKPAFGFDFSKEIIADDVIPCDDFPAIVNLTQREALVGVCDENASGKLAFMRSREVLNLMPTVARVQSKV